VVDGEVVVDTRRGVYFWEHGRYPQHWIPVPDVTLDRLPAGAVHRSDRAELADHVQVDWGAVDHWFEEDEEVFTHPRDPYTRIDILPSSRRVEVHIAGETVAETTRPRLLFETGLPTRYYLPLTDLRLDLLVPSDRVTHCPYKGAATYWSVQAPDRLHPDIVWTYRTPLPESRMIAGLAAFFNERVDLVVDGELQKRPRAPFS
jgi:uncharacterized protein (DUF427 family)